MRNLSRRSRIETRLRRRRTAWILWFLCAIGVFLAVLVASFEVYGDFERDPHAPAIVTRPQG